MSSKPDALPPLFILVGAVTALMGMVPLLAALGVIPADASEFGAPRWIVALFALAFVAVGLMLLLRALPSWRASIDPDAPWIRRASQACGVMVLIGFFGGALVFLNWKAFFDGGGGGAVTVTLLGLPLPLPPAIARVQDRLAVTFFALLFDLIVLAALGTWLGGRRRL